jgi:hypothetical protein
MDFERSLIHVALGIEKAVKALPGLTPVDQLNTANFDHTVSVVGREARGFGVKNNLTHVCLVS